jgi:hypothetical protein
MPDSAPPNTDRSLEESTGAQSPVPLLAGFATGFASVSLTMGVYWPFAPIFPALVAGVSALIPVRGHLQFAKGALMALVGVVVFMAVFTAMLYLVF